LNEDAVTEKEVGSLRRSQRVKNLWRNMFQAVLVDKHHRGCGTKLPTNLSKCLSEREAFEGRLPRCRARRVELFELGNLRCIRVIKEHPNVVTALSNRGALREKFFDQYERTSRLAGVILSWPRQKIEKLKRLFPKPVRMEKDLQPGANEATVNRELGLCAFVERLFV